MVKTRTRRRIAARSLCAKSQSFAVPGSFLIFLMCSFLFSLVLEQIHKNAAQSGRVSGIFFVKRVAMCQACCLLAQFGGQHLLGQRLAVNTGDHRRSGQKWRRARGSLAGGVSIELADCSSRS